MAKRKVRVVRTTEFQVEIPDALLTPEAVEDFEGGMFDIGADPEQLFCYAAEQISMDVQFVEGLGQVGKVVKYKETYDEFESEVMESKDEQQ